MNRFQKLTQELQEVSSINHSYASEIGYLKEKTDTLTIQVNQYNETKVERQVTMKSMLDQIAHYDKYQKELQQENVLLTLELKEARTGITRLNSKSMKLVKQEQSVIIEEISNSSNHGDIDDKSKGVTDATGNCMTKEVLNNIELEIPDQDSHDNSNNKVNNFAEISIEKSAQIEISKERRSMVSVDGHSGVLPGSAIDKYGEIHHEIQEILPEIEIDGSESSCDSINTNFSDCSRNEMKMSNTAFMLNYFFESVLEKDIGQYSNFYCKKEELAQELTDFIKKQHRPKGNKKFEEHNGKMKRILKELEMIIGNMTYLNWEEVDNKFMDLYIVSGNLLTE